MACRCGSPVKTRGRCMPCYLKWRKSEEFTKKTGVDSDKLPTYEAVHQRVRKVFGAASQQTCVGCSSQAEQWAYDGTDPTEVWSTQPWSNRNGASIAAYSRYPEFYMPMCRSCHTKRDRHTHRRVDSHAWKISVERQGDKIMYSLANQ